MKNCNLAIYKKAVLFYYAQIEEDIRFNSLEETHLRELRNTLESIICISIFTLIVMVTSFLKTNCYIFIIFGIPLFFLFLIEIYLVYIDYSGFKRRMLGRNND